MECSPQRPLQGSECAAQGSLRDHAGWVRLGPGPRYQQATRARAFTLVEMLAIIAVVSLLMGVLLPALSGVRRMGRSMLCQTNLRQMTLAATNYGTQWNCYPPAIRYERVGGSIHIVAWDWVTSSTGDELISPGPLWQLTDHPDRVMQCPDYQGPSNFGADPHTGYNYNTSYLGGEAMSAMVGWEIVRKGVPTYQCKRTSSCAIFGCGGYSGGANKFMRSPLNPNGHPLSLTYAGGQAFRHQDHSTNVAYLDGHTASVSQPKEGELATDDLLKKVMDHPDNGFLSVDDRAYNPR